MLTKDRLPAGRHKTRSVFSNALRLAALSTALALSGAAHAIDLAEGCTTVDYATDKNVFNWQFYLNMNADLIGGGYNTPAAACSHWLSNGRYEGRQAHPGFHSQQYLQRYADIAAAYGQTNYLGAIQHYVQNGLSEGRVGYLDDALNHGFPRSAVQGLFNGDKIFVSASTRTAGAIDSVMIANKELINAYDHGRDLQASLVRAPDGECYNPNEAGSNNDATGLQTTSTLIGSSAGTASISTSTVPAFWYHQGDAAQCPNAPQAPRADGYVISKRVDVGYLLPNVLRFSTEVDVYENVPLYGATMQSLAFEVPTGYMVGDLSDIFTVDPVTLQVSDVTADAIACANFPGHPGDPSRCNHANPLIHVDPARNFAMGVCRGFAIGGSFSPTSYQAASYLSSNQLSSTTKWNVNIALVQAVSAPKAYNFESFVVVAKSSGASDALQIASSTIQSLFQQGVCF